MGGGRGFKKIPPTFHDLNRKKLTHHKLEIKKDKYIW